MPKPMPLTAQTVAAISDARRVVYEVFAGDGVIDQPEREALLLLDTAMYRGERADYGRRASDVVRDTGEVSPWIVRQRRELERDFAHVNDRQAA